MANPNFSPTYHPPSDKATSPGFVESSSDAPKTVFSTTAETKPPLLGSRAQGKEYHPPSNRPTDWTEVKTSKDEPSIAPSAVSTPGVGMPGSFPRPTDKHSEAVTAESGDWNATLDGLKAYIPSREAVANTLTAAQATVQKTAQEYVPKAAEGVKGVVETVSSYFPGAPSVFASQEASTPAPANEYGGGPTKRGLNPTNPVVAEDLDQSQISDDAIAEAAQHLAKSGPLGGPEKPFAEPVCSKMDESNDKGDNLAAFSTHALNLETKAAADNGGPHVTTPHIASAVSIPSRPHHLPPRFGTNDSSTFYASPPTPPPKQSGEGIPDAGAASVRYTDGRNRHTNIASVPRGQGFLEGESGNHPVGDTKTKTGDQNEAPSNSTSIHSSTSNQGTSKPHESSHSDRHKPKLKDRLRGEVKVITGKLKHNERLVQEGRSLLNGSSTH